MGVGCGRWNAVISRALGLSAILVIRVGGLGRLIKRELAAPGAFVVYALTRLFYITPTDGRRQAPNEQAPNENPSVERS
jgi:hypothetical protein